MRCVVCLLALCCWAPLSASAADPLHEQLLDGDAPIVIRIADPLRLEDHPLPNRIYDRLLESEEYRRYLDSPALEPLLQLRQAVEAGFGQEWRTVLRQLTSGGVTFAIPSPGKDDVVLMMTTDSAKVANDFVETLETLLSADAKRKGEEFIAEEAVTGNVHTNRLGEIHVIRLGRRVALVNTAELAAEAVTRLGRAEASGLPDVGVADPNAPLIDATVDLDALRQADEFQEFIAVPRDENVGVLAFFGGYADLAKRGSTLRIAVEIPDGLLKIRASVDADRVGITPGLESFFAGKDGASAAPPLQLSGSIFSSSWYRDYSILLQSKEQLLTDDAREAFDKAEEQLQQQLSVVGLRSSPAKLVAQLGTDWRVAIAQQREQPYKVELQNRFPAGVFAVSLKDQKEFDKLISPLLRTFRLIVVANDNNSSRAVAKQSEYKNAQLESIWFRDDAKSVQKGDRNRFNFSPTYTITRGHFIFGSTMEIVRDTIDQLDLQATKKFSIEPNTTEVSRFDPSELSVAMKQFHEQLMTQVVFNNGYSVGTADRELDVFYSLLRSIGDVTLNHRFHDDRFEVLMTIGENPKEE